MTDETKRTRRVIQALGKMFAAEIDSAMNPRLLPIAQIGPSIGKQLVAEGLAEEVEATLPGRLPVKVSGYVLTLKGHMAYCMANENEEEDLAIEKATGAAGGGETP